MLRLLQPSTQTVRSFATAAAAKTAAVPRKRASRVAPATPTPQLRRNVKRINAAMAQTTIATVATHQKQSTANAMRVLGLDINTNSTGYAVLGGDGRVVTWGQIATNKFTSSDVLGIAHAISEELRVILADAAVQTYEEEVDHQQQLQWLVGIEDFMRMYRFGSFHNKGIFQLAQLNGIVSYSCFQQFGCRPVHTHPSAARGLFDIVAIKKQKGAAGVKDQVMEFVLTQERDSDACKDLHKNHVNKFGQWTDAAYDIADAYIVASYTRWMDLQETLQRDSLLQRQFHDAYMALALPAADDDNEDTTTASTTSTKKKASTKRKPTVEETALATMATGARQEYLAGLFAVGVTDWIKRQHQHQLPSEQEKEIC